MSYINQSKSFQQFMDMKIDTELKQYDDYFVKDEVTKNVMLDMAERSRKGYKKYGTTLHENNHQNMLQHAYEEALDFAQYLKKEITELNTIQDLVKQYSNDQELGKAIRAKYGQK
jgi:flagellar hook-basal body complex protein FliE